MTSRANDPRWTMLESARPVLIEAFGPLGVFAVSTVAAFPDLDGIEICLCTRTDPERDALGARNSRLEPAVRAILHAAGFSADQLSDLKTTAQSQESVDRDHEGIWYFAIRTVSNQPLLVAPRRRMPDKASTVQHA
jgi:hypothetical protein